MGKAKLEKQQDSKISVKYPLITSIPVNRLLPAPWNYKSDGTPEELEKLKNSIALDRSAGVPAVRQLLDPQGMYEVIDGNHRLKVIQMLDWEEANCEDFGMISLEQAILIARRRNHQWFSDDRVKLAELMKANVFPSRSLEELEKFMPDSRKELEELAKLVDFSWDNFRKAPLETKDGEDQQKEGKNTFDCQVKIMIPKEIFQQWMLWQERVREVLGYDNPSKAFEFAIIEAMAIPDEVLKAI